MAGSATVRDGEVLHFLRYIVLTTIKAFNTVRSAVEHEPSLCRFIITDSLQRPYKRFATLACEWLGCGCSPTPSRQSLSSSRLLEIKAINGEHPIYVWVWDYRRNSDSGVFGFGFNVFNPIPPKYTAPVKSERGARMCRAAHQMKEPFKAGARYLCR